MLNFEKETFSSNSKKKVNLKVKQTLPFAILSDNKEEQKFSPKKLPIK
jgi:hypothetical protein